MEQVPVSGSSKMGFIGSETRGMGLYIKLDKGMHAGFVEKNSIKEIRSSPGISD